MEAKRALRALSPAREPVVLRLRPSLRSSLSPSGAEDGAEDDDWTHRDRKPCHRLVCSGLTGTKADLRGLCHHLPLVGTGAPGGSSSLQAEPSLMTAVRVPESTHEALTGVPGSPAPPEMT